MTSVKEKIDMLVHRKKRLEEAREKVHNNRMNYDIPQFYEDSLNTINVGHTMAILIAPNQEEKELTSRSFGDNKAAQIMINRTDQKRVLGQSGKELYDELTQDCNSIFISINSVLSDPTFIYLPEKCSEFQIERLKKFNEDVKTFNGMHSNSVNVRLSYDGTGKNNVHDLDLLIERLESEKDIQK